MPDTTWNISDGIRLQQLRRDAGIDIASLARKCLLSVSQLSELEGSGPTGYFYSPRIKFAAGAKVLNALGAKHLMPVIDTSTAVQLATEPVPIASTRPLNTRSPITTRKWKQLLVPALLLVLIAGWLLGQLNTVSKPNVPPQLKLAITPEPISVPSSDATPVPEIGVPKSPSVAAASIAFPSNETPACASELNTQEPVLHINHPEPRKPGNYVYFEAHQDTTICVQNADGKITELTLHPGQGKSVFDTPPFKVWHPDSTVVQMYYQGRVVWGPSAEAGVTIFQP